MPTTARNGYEVHYRDVGSGPAVIMVHSSSSTGGQWRALIDALSDRYRCLAPDLIGYGGTAAWRPAPGARLYDDEIAVLEAMFDLADGPAHLVGHSYGGLLAIMATLRHPDRVQTLTALEPTLFTLLRETGDTTAFTEIERIGRRTVDLIDAGHRDSAARLFIDYWVRPGALDQMLDETRAAIVDSMGKLRHEWPFFRDEPLPTLADIAGIPCPVHIVRALDTTLAAARCVDLALGALPGAAYSEIPGGGHLSPVTRPDEVNPVIAGFLDAHRN